jgi:ATP-dependent protease HslVU (ClpYQ) peptidase subunit
VEKEIALLEDFNSNLEANSDQWTEKAEEAAKHLQDVEGSYRWVVIVMCVGGDFCD